MPRTITITGDSIPLPKRLAKKWRGRRVEFSDEGFFVVKPNDAEAEQAWQELLRGPKGLMRPSEIEREIQAYRAEKRARDHRS